MNQRGAIAFCVFLSLAFLSACGTAEKEIENSINERPQATVIYTPTLTSALISSVQPPQAQPTQIPIPEEEYLPLPDGTKVVWGGCASDGECHEYNFYWAPTNEVVMQKDEPQEKVQHELCHAHQHWSINGGAPLSTSDYNLESWYATAEGQSFTAAVAGLPWPWSYSAVNGLEDFAWTCTFYYLDPTYLLEVSPERYKWAIENLSQFN